MPFSYIPKPTGGFTAVPEPTSGAQAKFGIGKFGQARYGKSDGFTQVPANLFALTSARADEAVADSAKADMISQNYIPIERPTV